MAKYRKKPVVIEAHNVDDPDWPDWLTEARPIVTITENGTELDIVTLEGTMHANPDDWIIKGVKGELYPCKPDIFEATYTPETAFAGDAGPSPDWRDSVPWLALRILVCDPKDWPTSYEEVQSRVDTWLVANAPVID